MKLLVLLGLLFVTSASFANDPQEESTAGNSASCRSSLGCTKDEAANECRDILDDPNSPAPKDLGEAPTGY